MDATARQKVAIARLSMALKVAEPVEEKSMNRGRGWNAHPAHGS